MTVDHESPEPLYRQVAAILRARIDSGELTSRMPSIKTITQEYGVSHVTAEKAIALLREEGRVVVVIGRGAYVRRPQQGNFAFRPESLPRHSLLRNG